MHHDDQHDDFGGLHRDLLQTGTIMDRRNALRFAKRLGMGLGALQLLGCSSTSATGTLVPDPTGGTTSGSCSKIPEETAGPYPGDASNGPNTFTSRYIDRSPRQPA